MTVREEQTGIEKETASKPKSYVCILLAVLAIIAGAPSVDAKALRVLVLTDAAGLGDKGFNDACWQGVQKAKTEFGMETQFLQSREQADYVPNLTIAAQRADVVVTLGFLYADAVREVAPHFPGTRFIHIEGEIAGDNVACFDFKSEEGGFLAGLVAGLFTKSRKAGAVSGMDIPPVEAYVSGFRAGMVTAEKIRGESLEAIVVSAGSFNDPVKGKSLAQALIGQGVDVVFRLAGNTGVGVLDAVRSADGTYLIGEDLDMDNEIPGRVLTSTLKRMDTAIYETLRAISQGGFKPGHRWMGVAEGGMDITEMQYTKHLFKPADIEAIQKAKAMLKEGKPQVPKTRSELAGFEPPVLASHE